MKQVYCFIKVFIVWSLVGIFSKGPFLLIYHGLVSDVSLWEQLSVFLYGLRLDIAIAGYLTLLPGLMLIVSLWYKGRFWNIVWKGYFLLTSFLSSLAYVSNIGLYGFWGFPLDNTPLLYLKTSPTDAMASMTWWQLVISLFTVFLVGVVIYKIFPKNIKNCPTSNLKKILFSLLLLLIDFSLLLPIRGGIGTGTNHTGSVYFSTNIRLNHAAVNPIFSFVEAVLHQEEIGNKYRFMSAEEADSTFEHLVYTNSRNKAMISIQHPNIILIVLESFSDTVMNVKGVTPYLQKYTHEGIYFTDFYANSFRTDRALVSIHSGLPAQPTMSVMDMPRKSTSLPSIAKVLGGNGYKTAFYYGGDINYSNMRSYFIGTGFQRIVSDVDFPVKLRTGKWGVADGAVFDRILNDIKSGNTQSPFFYSFMTASSHEPFDVPNYNKIKDDEALNAFSYTDYCLGQFVESLKELPCWQHTIVAIVPDHLGAYPENIDNYQLWRYRIPFVMFGGALPEGVFCNAIGSQIDIPATLLGLLGFDHSEFIYSKDLLDTESPHFAFFTFPDAMGMVTDSSSVIYDNTSNKVHQEVGPDTEILLKNAKAYLQKVYDDLDKR